MDCGSLDELDQAAFLVHSPPTLDHGTDFNPIAPDYRYVSQLSQTPHTVHTPPWSAPLAPASSRSLPPARAAALLRLVGAAGGGAFGWLLLLLLGVEV